MRTLPVSGLPLTVRTPGTARRSDSTTSRRARSQGAG